MAEPNAANVFAGPTVLYTAPAATAPPSLASLHDNDLGQRWLYGSGLYG